jgi:hypothetical protein
MDLLQYRMDQGMLSTSTRNRGITLAAATFAAGTGVAAVLLQSSNNQLAAFQAGLASVQAVTAANAGAGPPPSARKAN